MAGVDPIKTIDCSGKLSASLGYRLYGALSVKYTLLIKHYGDSNYSEINNHTINFTISESSWVSDKYTLPSYTFSTYSDGSSITTITSDNIYFYLEILGAATHDSYIGISSVIDGDGNPTGTGTGPSPIG